MDFKNLIGKQVLWTGEFANESVGCPDTYVLFSDGMVGLFPHKDADMNPQILEGLDALKTHLAASLPHAENILALKASIEKLEAPKPAAEGHMTEATEEETKTAHPAPVATESVPAPTPEVPSVPNA